MPNNKSDDLDVAVEVAATIISPSSSSLPLLLSRLRRITLEGGGLSLCLNGSGEAILRGLRAGPDADGGPAGTLPAGLRRDGPLHEGAPR